MSDQQVSGATNPCISDAPESARCDMPDTSETKTVDREPSQRAIDTFAEFGLKLEKHNQDERARILRALCILFEVRP
jgi:hypothetical protein